MLRLCLATAKQNRPRLLRSCELCEAETPTYPTAREKWRHSFADAKRREFKSNLTFSGCRSRWVKFEAGSYKFNFKFEHKAIMRSIFLLRCARSFSRSSRRGAFKFGDGSYLVGNDRAKFKSLCLQLRVQRTKATYRAKRQAAKKGII